MIRCIGNRCAYIHVWIQTWDSSPQVRDDLLHRRAVGLAQIKEFEDKVIHARFASMILFFWRKKPSSRFFFYLCGERIQTAFGGGVRAIVFLLRRRNSFRKYLRISGSFTWYMHSYFSFCSPSNCARNANFKMCEYFLDQISLGFERKWYYSHTLFFF